MKNKIPKATPGRPLKYRFDTLEINTCLKFKKKEDGQKAIVAAYQYGKRTGKRFVQRKGGLEIWRES